MASKRRDGRGGVRPGAGRKPLFDVRGDLKVAFEQADLDALGELAGERGVSTAELVREAVSAYLVRARKSRSRR